RTEAEVVLVLRAGFAIAEAVAVVFATTTADRYERRHPAGDRHLVQDVRRPAVEVAATTRRILEIGFVVVVLAFHCPVVEERPAQRNTRSDRGVVVAEFSRRIEPGRHRVDV